MFEKLLRRKLIDQSESMERRAFTRFDFGGRVRLDLVDEKQGVAVVHDVSRGGLCLSLGDYVSPGEERTLTFEDIYYRGKPITVDARVTWSRSCESGSIGFLAGFHIIDKTAATLAAVSEVVYAALDHTGRSHAAV